MKSLLTLLLCLLLGACASTRPDTSATKAPAAAAAPAAKADSTDMVDRLQASWVNTASEGLSLRSGRAVGVATLRELDAQCRKGLMVELITTPKAAQAALAQTQCISVWRSVNPDIVRSPQVLIVDGYSLVVEGMLRHSNSQPVKQELIARAQLKRMGIAEPLR